MKNKFFFLIAIVALAMPMIQSCSPAKGNSPGHEYMPDMGHSVAYEANKYENYSYTSWDNQSVISRKTLTNPHLPVSGTVPRGYMGMSDASPEREAMMMQVLTGQSSQTAIRTPINGHVNYAYSDTEEDRLKATAAIVRNPFPISKKGLAKGKELYEINCGICHGNDGGGAGYLVSEANPQVKYPAQPANFIQDAFITSNNGRYYHAIVYGKNVMGGYTDKLSYEERWQVIHYIRSLQAKSKNLRYDENQNAFLPSTATPDSVIQAAAKALSAAKIIVDDKKAPATVEHKEEAHGGGEAHHKK
ncbi:MAG: hypothetical protein RLZZ292_1756 [Bacteroidota bacterium]|jgi:mono/diheme cytochrome c family protein